MEIDYLVNPQLASPELNELYAVSWPNHEPPYEFGPELHHALVVVTACHQERLIGFVRLAWDGGIHAFLLEPTVHPDFRRRGIGRALVERAVAQARECGMHYVHVDYEPYLHPFYEACGFRSTPAGLIRLR